MPDEDPIRRQRQMATPTLRELAMVLFRQRRVFVLASGAVLSCVLLYAIAGARYRAHMKVMVRPGRADAPVSSQQNAPLDLTHLVVTEEELNSEVELLRDTDVLRRAVVENGLSQHDWLHFLRPKEQGQERVERAARRLASKLRIEPVKKTNLIAIGYASDDPRLAADVLRSLANAYLEKHATVRRPSGQVSFFERQTKEASLHLEAAERKLREFSAERQVVAAGQQRDLALQRMSEIDSSYRRARIDLAETQERVAMLQAKTAELPERNTTQIRTADNPELLKALKASLLDLQLKRTQLLNKFEPNHRLVKEVEEQIAQAQSAITAERLTPVREETTDKNTHYEWAKSELERAEVELKGLQARTMQIEAEAAAYRSICRKLGEDAVTQDDLESSERAARESYLLYLKKQEEARMADALDQQGIANVAMAEEPVAPTLPVWSTWTLLVLGLAAASAAGTGAAFAADYVDPVFRTPEDVVACLQMPVLASLPANLQRRRMA